jgi:hypothetical protein
MSHLWLAPLAEDLIATFSTAFTLSAKKRGFRVSTERFLAALPETHKEQMLRLCKDAQSECKMSVSAADLPAPPLPADWQDKICFSTCIERTLLKCQPGTDLTTFLRLLCTTAVRLHCVVDRSLPIELYLTNNKEATATLTALPLPASPSAPVDIMLSGPQEIRTLMELSVEEQLPTDVLELVMAKASSVETLRNCKAVCKSWRQGARRTLCDVAWLRDHHISLHELLKKGCPSPQLVLALANERPVYMHERDGEGLLPLQYAAAYRMNADLVAALRQATASVLPVSAVWAGSAEARSIKSHLRHVRTRVAHVPIAA